MCIPCDGIKAATINDGRTAALDAIQKNIDKCEVIYIDVELYGGDKSDPPAGIIVWLYYEPDYMQD